MVPRIGRHAHRRPVQHGWRIIVAVCALAASASLLATTAVWQVAAHWAGGTTSARASDPEALSQAAPPPALGEQAERRSAGLAKVLDARAEALLRGDREGWLAAVASSAPQYRQAQALVFRRLQAVHVTAWRYQVHGDAGPLPADRQRAVGGQAWLIDVTLSYRLAADTRDIQRSQQLTVVQEGDGWRVAADTDGVTQRDLWDLGQMYEVDGDRSLIVGTARHQARLARYAKEVDAAAKRVDAAWGRAWPRTVVVLVPDDKEQMAQLLGRDSTAGMEQIAAVTIGELDRQEGATEASATADRIILNPAAFDQMGSLGRQIVLTHEVTHVATRASAVVSAPLWLEEGFADYLAYRNTGLSRREIAKDLIRDVRARKGPTALPDSDSFDAMRHTDVAPAYVASWFAVQTIADRSDPDEVVRFYRIATGMDRDGAAVTPDQALAEAFAEVLGTDEATFESQWLAAVRRLAGRAG